ncbi:MULTISPECIES: hypothetical protein [Rhizobium]|uniref:Uncharacterized protein n=1 Tax=Rhizobium tropici TaxID=398 RepID=A0A6P1C348_RHITR|nr:MULTISPECIES: hypothetical protein [Rhizobium]AGB71843.1 hypothetical protein RTCIAT899_CH12315 [Rhizobium tropici CIAT 899]MBB4243739.1 hypothetical protein [Rhizobium tropici]MBB5593286.1 hypothetical protein [Rhizobium tropici]MBB6494079.1 hypothetical protein [Rhizobium tropici]NEV09775.1 hypothetical protein [Rhizobium tropici]
MLGYRKRSFDRAHGLLAVLRNNQINLTALRELQGLLLAEIILTEGRIRTLKSELKTIDPDAPDANLKRFVYLSNRIEGLRRCAFIWRCFGDAIAFLYMDKYALKQTVYNTDNYNAKQSSGFIGGKDGLDAELSLLDDCIAKGIPALLVDITNTIRHGDVCIMVGSDPILIEVKNSAKRLNPRGRKQARSLELLTEFFETDRAKGLRGMPEVRRHAQKVMEEDYAALMNVCIANVGEAGYAVEQPEKGLFYFAARNALADLPELFRDLGLREPLIYPWNMLKSQQTWVPFIPFTLTIQDKEALWDFVQGKLYIMVLLEIDRLEEIAAEFGAKATYDSERDPNFPLGFELVDGLGLSGLSSQMIARAGMDCVSPTSIIHNAIETYRSFAAQKPAERADAAEPTQATN